MQILVPGLYKLAAVCIFLRQLFPNMIDKFQRDGERPVIRNFLFIFSFFSQWIVSYFPKFSHQEGSKFGKNWKIAN